MKNRMPSGSGGWRGLRFCVLLCGACGGRAVTIEGSTPNGASGNGGAVAVAGAANVGGAGGKAGASSAGSPGAGAPSGGAGNNCSQVECPALACGAGAMLVLEPGACCPTCESNCAAQPCPDIACASGYQLMTQVGQCCPTCVASPMLDCAMGQQNYQQSRAQLTGKYEEGCTSDAECIVVAPVNACETGCSYVAVLGVTFSDLTTNLASAAMTDCANCAPTPSRICSPPPVVSCVQGQCEIGALD
jgi:hypothetical protein